ncbi:MAG: hypothetical protein J3Q66DRAFT_404393 [Benniella sp.]|nr:MAG: hypothetical protein J3Q66DRAFT_404393 [Benniella sp.]
MFGITELDELIIQKLERTDVARGARVCRKWHQIISPYLWHDLSCLRRLSDAQKQAFARLVEEDYLCQQRHQALQEQHHPTEHYPQTSTLPTLSPLAKYGPWIQVLPPPGPLLLLFQPTPDPSQLQQAIDLMLHLYKRCINIQIGRLELETRNLQSDEFMKAITECLLPHAHELFLCGSSFLESWRFKYILDRCSDTLEKLIINIAIKYDEEERGKEHSLEGSKPFVGLKRLNLVFANDKSGSKALWPWLWRRCTEVEEITIIGVNDIVQSLVEGMHTYMPKLNRIHIRAGLLNDTMTAALLSTCQRGWKEIDLDMTGTKKEALVKHCPTLEKLTMDASVRFSSGDIVQVLSSSPNLHTLCYTEGIYWGTKIPCIDASSFVDRDSSTDTLKPWKCEASLRILKILILGIPRSDLQGRHVPETHLGQGRAIQGQVYDRLARLTNMETLWLGPQSKKVTQFDCVEMSLESGLWKLAGLTALQELSVQGMAARIGVKEVEWMAGNWPRLRAIYGLKQEGGDGAAVEWLLRHCPEIKLELRFPLSQVRWPAKTGPSGKGEE